MMWYAKSGRYQNLADERRSHICPSVDTGLKTPDRLSNIGKGGNERTFWGNERKFWGNERKFWGNESKFWGNGFGDCRSSSGSRLRRLPSPYSFDKAKGRKFLGSKEGYFPRRQEHLTKRQEACQPSIWRGTDQPFQARHTAGSICSVPCTAGRGSTMCVCERQKLCGWHSADRVQCAAKAEDHLQARGRHKSCHLTLSRLNDVFG